MVPDCETATVSHRPLGNETSSLMEVSAAWLLKGLLSMAQLQRNASKKGEKWKVINNKYTEWCWKYWHRVRHDSHQPLEKVCIVCIYIYTSSTAQGGGGSFKNRKTIGEVGCCESGMAERCHWWIERCLISLTLSLPFSDYLPTYLSIFHVSIYLSIYLSIDLSIYLSLSFDYPIYLSIDLSISLSLSFICLSV